MRAVCLRAPTISSNGNFLSRYLLSTKSLPYDNSNIHISYSFKRIKIPLLLSIAGFEFNFESSDKFIDIRAQERRINFTPIRSKMISILSQFKSLFSRVPALFDPFTRTSPADFTRSNRNIGGVI